MGDFKDVPIVQILVKDPQPLLFLGEMVDFDSLRLKNLRQFEGW